jgi:hypothetical protein
LSLASALRVLAVAQELDSVSAFPLQRTHNHPVSRSMSKTLAYKGAAMPNPAFDADALISMFESASASGSAKLREGVEQATLAALRGRELTLKNIRSVLGSVTQAVSQGAAKNVAGIDPATLLDKAVMGMDDALLKAVQANRAALQQFVDGGADLREKHLKKALDDLDKFEDTLMGAVKKAAADAGPLTAPWQQMLEKMQAGGTLSGSSAASAAEQFAKQMQDGLRGGRAAGMRAAQALAESYAAMASGVLVGMMSALQQGHGDTAAPKAAAKKRTS